MKAGQKAIIKSVAISAVGVLVAGFVLFQFRGNSIADRSRSGFN